MIHASLRWLPVVIALAGAGCATNMVGVGVGEAERPVADRPPADKDEARARAHVSLGEAYLQAGNYGVALDEAKIALGADSRYAPTYLLIATIYMFLDDPASARANFDQALRLAPLDPEINNTYGWFLCASGQEQQGLERLAVTMRNPYYRTPARPYANAGLCYLRLKDDTAAETNFLKAVELDPANSQAFLQLADIAFRRGNYVAAQRYLATLHQLGPVSPASAWLGLRTERKLGNKEAAASYALQLKSRFPTSTEYQLLLQGKID